MIVVHGDAVVIGEKMELDVACVEVQPIYPSGGGVDIPIGIDVYFALEGCSGNCSHRKNRCAATLHFRCGTDGSTIIELTVEAKQMITHVRGEHHVDNFGVYAS